MRTALHAVILSLAACGSTRLAPIERTFSRTATAPAALEEAPAPRIPITSPRTAAPDPYAYGSSKDLYRSPLAEGRTMVDESAFGVPASLAPREVIAVGKQYTTLSLGAFDPAGDLNSFDTGFWGDLAYGRKFLVFLAVEGSVGYYESKGSGSEVYGVPILIDARFGLPILIFEGYLGAGVGGAWVHSKADGFSSQDDFVLMWDGFVGLEVGLAGFNLGLEYKYVRTDSADSASGGTFDLEGSVFSLTGTIPW